MIGTEKRGRGEKRRWKSERNYRDRERKRKNDLARVFARAHIHPVSAAGRAAIGCTRLRPATFGGRRAHFSRLRCVAWYGRGCFFLGKGTRRCCNVVAAVWRGAHRRRHYNSDNFCQARSFFLLGENRLLKRNASLTCGRRSRAIVRVVWHSGQRPAAATLRSYTVRASVPRARLRLEFTCGSSRGERRTRQEAARRAESGIFLLRWVFILSLLLTALSADCSITFALSRWDDLCKSPLVKISIESYCLNLSFAILFNSFNIMHLYVQYNFIIVFLNTQNTYVC